MNRAIGILAGGLTAAGIVTACATSHELIAYEVPDSGTSPAPPFTPSSADGGDAAPTVTDARLLCIATACPAPYATCGDDYRCSTNLSNDSNNCGQCGKECPVEFGYLHMTSTCVNGTCEPVCEKVTRYMKPPLTFADCNKVLEDGCEINVSTDPNNCGACGKKCADGVACIDGKCGCDPGFDVCNGECVDVRNDDDNCGACGNACQTPPDAGAAPEHMHYGCIDKQCGQLKCDDAAGETWADCDQDQKNGCEVYVGAVWGSEFDPNNCGKCGKQCTGDQLCAVTLTGGVPECTCENPQHTRCGSVETWNLDCYDLLNDVENCGTCFNKCTAFTSNTVAACRKGVCEVECAPGWGDCDDNPKNGCETNLKISDGHCGACGNRCDTQAGQPCVDGQCAMAECDAGVQPQ